jgi:hypothetical protein
MHTITKQRLTQKDFAYPIPKVHLTHLNRLIKRKDWEAVKHDLPESFLQQRVVCLNYMVLQRIIRQRRDHRLTEWHEFIDAVLAQAQYPGFLQKAESS